MLALRNEIQNQALGTIMHAEAAFSHDKLAHVQKGDWRTLKAVSPAAGMTAMEIHLTDLLISFFGRVETVHAMTVNRSLGWETGDVVTVQLGFEAGMTATLSAVLHTPHFIRIREMGRGAGSDCDLLGGQAHGCRLRSLRNTQKIGRLGQYRLLCQAPASCKRAGKLCILPTYAVLGMFMDTIGCPNRRHLCQ
ncbi:MAG: Gfo/Idh/MocA family protein [Geminicoccaceae bacterium]